MEERHGVGRSAFPSDNVGGELVSLLSRAYTDGACPIQDAERTASTSLAQRGIRGFHRHRCGREIKFCLSANDRPPVRITRFAVLPNGEP